MKIPRWVLPYLSSNERERLGSILYALLLMLLLVVIVISADWLINWLKYLLG